MLSMKVLINQEIETVPSQITSQNYKSEKAIRRVIHGHKQGKCDDNKEYTNNNTRYLRQTRNKPNWNFNCISRKLTNKRHGKK